MMKANLCLLVSLVAWLLVGCGDSHDSHGHAAHAGHTHVAPHGGTLVEVGEHAFNVELIRDLPSGKLTAFVLDGHAESFVRLPIEAFELVIDRAGGAETLRLAAVANPKTGEKVGDTSQFEVQAEWLKTPGALTGSIKELDIRGSKFSGVKFQMSAQ